MGAAIKHRKSNVWWNPARSNVILKRQVGTRWF